MNPQVRRFLRRVYRYFFNLPYRLKLLITHLGVVLLVVAAITVMITLQASRQVLETSTAGLHQFTEQVLINFTNSVQNAERYLYSTSVSTGTVTLMAQINTSLPPGRQERLDLVYCLSKMIDSYATYDHVAVRFEDGTCVSSNTYDLQAAAQSEALLSDPQYLENRYGQAEWVRTPEGDVYMLRDVYSTSPLRHVGKMCARMKQSGLVSVGSYNEKLDCSVLFFSPEGEMIVGGGKNTDALVTAAADQLDAPQRSVSVSGTEYAVRVLRRQNWTAVGFLPMESIVILQNSIIQSGIVAALLGVLVGLLLSVAVSNQMAGQIRQLVDSMHRVEAGELDVSIPVQSRDEIGVLTGQFNRMTAKTRELVQKLIEEENSKRRAEYQSLDYEYRFLHWQINPHFIYNALETINAMAKIDGNDELSDMIVMLSAYFRQNTENMRKKFVTVEQEFLSLQQYAEIYCGIYGDLLTAEFNIAPEAEGAFLPTMLIQPLLENALVHGGNTQEDTKITVSAGAEDGQLVVCVQDNGKGMQPEMVRQILGGDAPLSQSGGEKTSLGVRNVLERMHLLYGGAASMQIESEPGRGTRVILRIPLRRGDAQAPPL